jgi:hypothetical protein
MIHDCEIIYIPIFINYFTNIKIKYLLKYSKKILKILNEGFSGKSFSKYKKKYDVNKIYGEKYIKNIINNSFKNNNSIDIVNESSKLIYDLINIEIDTKIKFFLVDCKYNNINNDILVYDFLTNDFVNNNCININIIETKKFHGSTNYAWDFISNKITPQIYLNYKTINNNYSKTIIHEMGHLFGLVHTFNNVDNSKKLYKKQFENNYYNILNDDCINRIYYDIPQHHVKTELNPFNTGVFPINNNNEIINFCNFMNYGEDDVLVNFSLCQIKIMRLVLNKYLFNFCKNNEKII